MFSLAWMVVLCAGSIQGALAQTNPADPWERYNRAVYRFNRTFDLYLLRPVATTYVRIVPTFAKRRVSSFFDNLDDINVVANDVLQGKGELALQDSGRFLVNTTLGVAGLFDVASRFGLYKHNEDFGQTLGYWGFDKGPYLVLPFLGSSTLRDAFGIIPNTALDPVFWIDESGTRQALYVMDTIDTRIRFLSAETMVRGDEYSFVRNAWLQRRDYLVADGRIRDEFDDF